MLEQILGFTLLHFQKSIIQKFILLNHFPETYNYLKKNIEINNYKNIHPFNFGLLDKNINLKMGDPKPEILSNQAFGWLKKNSLFESGYKTILYDKNDTSSKECKFVKGDDFILNNEFEKIDLLKIDVEGSELETLNGLRKSIENFMPIIQIELNRNISNNIKEVIDLIKSFNYKKYSIFNDRYLEKISLNKLFDDQVKGSKDYLFFN